MGSKKKFHVNESGEKKKSKKDIKKQGGFLGSTYSGWQLGVKANNAVYFPKKKK